MGAAVLLAIIYGCETMVGRMYPSPTGTDFEQARVLDRLMNQLPRGTFAGLFLGYALASLIGGVITTLLSGRTEIIPAVVTGVVAMVVSVFNPYEAPHPLWFTAASVLSFIPFACLGYLISRKPPVRKIYGADFTV